MWVREVQSVLWVQVWFKQGLSRVGCSLSYMSVRRLLASLFHVMFPPQRWWGMVEVGVGRKIKKGSTFVYFVLSIVEDGTKTQSRIVHRERVFGDMFTSSS